MKRFALDAAIVFSDILVIPDALGLDVTFGPGEGPRIGKPLKSAADLASWNTAGIQERLAFLPGAIAHLRAALGDDKAILGFCGAPFTLFCYAVDGGSSDDFRAARTMMHREPELATRALNTFADIAADLLLAEQKAGADCVQMFDTWGGLLAPDEYQRFCVPALKRITDKTRKAGLSTILFVRGGHHLLPVLGEVGVDALSLDWRTPYREARKLHPKLTLQGNVDPVLLFAGDDVVKTRTRALMDEIKALDDGRRAIINLGHGILPGTPESAVEALVNEVVRGF
jgi:uroporphyrinogen decarboxylase